MVGIYFSGTGNTRFCVKYMLSKINQTAQAYSIEDSIVPEVLASEEKIVFGYPIYYSNLPKIVRDYINNHSDIWKGKKLYLIATMGLFSGDGTGVAARLLKRYGAIITGGLHLKMPDCIGDVKELKKSQEENIEIVKCSMLKMENAAKKYKEGKFTQEGLGILYHLAGLFGQRLYFCNKTKSYSDKLKINQEKCIGCGKCSEECPMNNISLNKNKAVPGNKCTMCYRCISNCPVQAITLIGKEVLQQSRIENYIRQN